MEQSNTTKLCYSKKSYHGRGLWHWIWLALTAIACQKESFENLKIHWSFINSLHPQCELLIHPAKEHSLYFDNKGKVEILIFSIKYLILYLIFCLTPISVTKSGISAEVKERKWQMDRFFKTFLLTSNFSS